MDHRQIAPGVTLTTLPGEKFKRLKISASFVLPGERPSATAMAVLPHVLERRSAAIPDATALSRKLFSLYGAELSCESASVGANRVITLAITGLKNQFAIAGEDLTEEYLSLLCGLIFAPYLENGVFAAEDVAIETEKQADFLRSEMNDKRSYCLRQARRKLYGDSLLGLESSGYLEDIPALTPASLHAAYTQLLRQAQVELVVCGADAEAVAARFAAELASFGRAPVPTASAAALENRPAPQAFAEAMETVQGKLCLLFTSGHTPTAEDDAVLRMATALLGGLPTSRLFTNVREKQSLCYYCAAVYGYYGGVLSIDSGVEHQNATRARDAILHELSEMQQREVTEKEMAEGRLALQNAYAAAADNLHTCTDFALAERLRGTGRTLAQVSQAVSAVTAQQVCAALATFVPAVEYRITAKEAAK